MLTASGLGMQIFIKTLPAASEDLDNRQMSITLSNSLRGARARTAVCERGAGRGDHGEGNATAK
jgi:hypothetical protein